MLKSTFDFLEYGILGYVFAILGVVAGFLVISNILKSLKPKKYKKMDNIIMDNYVIKKKTAPKDQFEDLPKSEPNEEFDEYVHISDENIHNDPFTYSEILSGLKDERISDTVSSNRKREDDKYGIIKRKLEQKQSNIT